MLGNNQIYGPEEHLNSLPCCLARTTHPSQWSLSQIHLLEMSDVQMADFGHLDLYCIFLCIPRGYSIHSISLRGSYHLRLSLVELCQKGTMTKVVT